MRESELRRAVLAEARSWIGTPFLYGACVKGAGVDCGRFLAACVKNAGVREIDLLALPHLPPLWFVHNGSRSYLDIIRRYATEYELQPEQIPQPADIVVAEYSKDWAHSAIVLEWPSVIGAAYEMGVCIWKNLYLSPQYMNRRLKFFTLFGK